MRSATDDTGITWFRTYRHDALYCEQPRLKLVCLPHAGGNASFFRRWRELLPPDIELVAVRYPGREDRITEPSPTRMEDLGDQIAQALVDSLERPLALFGHSMGANTAYEVAMRLEHTHGISPAWLFVSAGMPPHLAAGGDLHRQNDEALLAEVRRLGDDLDLAALADPQLRELFLMATRADYRLIECYRPDRCPPITSPITALVGAADPTQTRDDAHGWSQFTVDEFDLVEFPGGHFYLTTCHDAVVNTVASRL